MKITIILFLIATLLFGCRENVKYDKTLDRTSEIINMLPDSVLSILYSMESETKHMSEKQRMRYLLLKTVAENKCDTVFSSDSTQRMLVDYYDRNGSSNERMMAHYLLGRAYADMNDMPRALEAFLKATNCADTTADDCDCKTLGIVHIHIADIYTNQNLPQYGIVHNRLAAHYAAQCKDTLDYLYAKDALAGIHGILGNYDSVVDIKEQLAAQYRRMNREEESAQVLGSCVYACLHLGNMAKAKAYMDLYKCRSGFFDKQGRIAQGHELYYYHIGTYYMAVNKIDSAEFYFRLALDGGKDFNTQIAASQGLCRVFERKGFTDSVAKYAERSYQLNDSAYVLATANNMQQMQAMYDYDRANEAAVQSQYREEQAKNKLLLLSCMFVLLLLVAFYFFKKQQKRRHNLLKEQEATRLMYLEDKETAKKETRQLKELLDRKEMAEQEKIKQKDALIGVLNKRIADYERMTGENEETSLGRIFETKIFERFQLLSTYGVNKPREKDWQDLMAAVETENQKIRVFLRGKCRLKEEDYRLCLLVLLNFSPSQLVTLLDKDYSFVSKRRRRLYKLVFGQDGSPNDFDVALKSALL